MQQPDDDDDLNATSSDEFVYGMLVSVSVSIVVSSSLKAAFLSFVDVSCL